MWSVSSTSTFKGRLFCVCTVNPTKRLRSERRSGTPAPCVSGCVTRACVCAYLQMSLNVTGYLQHVPQLGGLDLVPQERQGQDGRLHGRTDRRRSKRREIQVTTKLETTQELCHRATVTFGLGSEFLPLLWRRRSGRGRL